MVYILFVVARFVYKEKHRPVLPAIVRNELTIGSGSALRYIAAGDSTSVGEGASSVGGTYPYKLLQEFSKGHAVTYKNIGVSGAKTSDVINTQLEQIINFDPDVVTISIGANDATHLWSQKKTLENFKTIIAELTTKTHATIYMANVPTFKGGTLLPYLYIQLLEFRSNQLNAEIAKLETDRVKIVNVHDYGWEKFPNMRETLSADSFHPNNTGYQNWTNAFLSRMQ